MINKLRIFILLVFVLSNSSTFSQEAQNYLVSPKGDTIKIKAIPLADIPGMIESGTAKIKKIEERLVPSADYLKVDSIYESLRTETNIKKQKIADADDYYSLINLENDIQEWTVFKDDLDSWKQLINDRITLLQEDLFDLQTLKATWVKTIEVNKDEGIPENVLTSEKDLLNKIIATEKKELRSKTEALSKQNKLTDLSVTIDDVISELKNAKQDLQSDYFRQDSPRIWQAGDTSANLKSVKKQLLNTKAETRRNLINFYESNKRTVNLQILIFLLLWLGFYILHRTSLKMEGYQDVLNFNNAREILSYNALSAFILALFSSVWLYDSIPVSITDIIQLIYLILAVYVIPKFINKKFRTVLIHLLILFFLNQFTDIFYGKVLFARLVLFIESIYVGWIIYRILYARRHSETMHFRHKWNFIFKILPVFFFFLAVSVFGNIFGYVNLAVLLENTVVKSLFNFVILILAVLVTDWVIVVFLRTPFAQSSNIVKKYTDDIERRLNQIVKTLAIFLWLRAGVKLLGLLDPLVEWFNEFIQESYKVGSTTIEISGIFTFFLVIISTIIVFRSMKLLLADEIFPRVTLPRGVAGSISMITGYFIAGFGIYVAIGAAGVDLSSFGLVAGALGVGIGFGLQGIVANFIAGLVLAFERPIQVGDTIQLAQMYGDVKHIGVRSTTIKTYDGSEVIVPNSSLITNDVINWTLSDRKKRRDINVGVAYGSDPDKVMEIMRKVANDHPDVQKVPAPWALFDGFGDSALNFRIRIWTTMDNGMTTKSQVTVAIYHALDEAGISIPFPQRDLHIKSIAEGAEEKKLVPRKKTTPIKNIKKPSNEEVEDDD